MNEDVDRTTSITEVKLSKQVHRLWKDGDQHSQEYFLVENRSRKGYDQYLPGEGLLSKLKLRLKDRRAHV